MVMNWFKNRTNKDGAALVIVLGMVVLLTALIVAFFSRALLEQQISYSSANQTKVDIFSQGAIDTIQSDLKQQILVLSSTTTVSGTVNLYRPLVSSGTLQVSPSRYSLTGLVVSNTDLPNLVGMSSEYALYNSGTVRASSALSTGTSLNGRTISTARWNKPLLLPKNDPSSTDLSPNTTTFPSDGSKSPRWILVARDGKNPTAWDNNLRVGSGGSEVTGRYAFMIYNEGGLLDANVAGSPAVSSGTRQAIWSRKGAVAFADLTQLPYMTQPMIDQLVAWRNYANVKPNGVFPNLSIGNNQIDNYFDFLLGQTSRFMAVSGSLYQGQGNSLQSDHVFSSRQQLINFLTEGLNNDGGSKAERQNALQYLGTFSRSLNQPSYYFERPTGNYPAILTAGSVLGLTVSSTTINVQFPEVRVTGSFTRNDGAIARQGDPLVAKRFALSRILWLTYKGPSANNMTGGDDLFNEYVKRGMPADTVRRLMQQGTDTNIRKYFGLRWDGSKREWFYDPDGTGNATVIKCLGDITGREPNFFELLKAGMRVGAIGRRDSSTGIGGRDIDCQVIQIGANIIDQGQPENFPTTIYFNSRANWGTVDLPYMYGLITVAVLKSKGKIFPKGGTPQYIGNTVWDSTQLNAIVPIPDPGAVTLMDVPIIWNPHQRNTTDPLSSSLTPTKLRVCISSYNITDGNLGASGVTPMLRINSSYSLSNNIGSNNWRRNGLSYSYGNRDTGKGYIDMSTSSQPGLDFDLPVGSDLYREPTPLLRKGYPANSNLKAEDTTVNQVTEYGSMFDYVGFKIADWNSIYQGDVNGANATKYTFAINYFASQSSNYFTLSLEYFDGSNWVPYRQVAMTKGGNQVVDCVAYDYDSAEDAKGFNGNPYLQSKVQAWRGNRTGYSVNVAGTIYPTNYEHEVSVMLDPRMSWLGDVVTLGGVGNGTVGQWLDPNEPAEIETFAPTTNPSTWEVWHGGIYGAYSTNMLFSPARETGWNNTDANHYAVDFDGVVRRPIGSFGASSATGVGMPLLTVKGHPERENNRPVMLQRPYRSVAELGYVFANYQWRQLSMITPESGFNALLDIFCVNDDERPDALEAGRVDLNTLQTPVLQSILMGAGRDELTALSTSGTNLPITTDEAKNIASALVARTSGTAALENVADLVGRYTASGGLSLGYEKIIPYDGLTADLAKPNVYQGELNTKIQRFMESAIRALADSGQAGTWNLMFDVITQTGRYGATADNLDKFTVEGEKRYWVHVAIDRRTGKIIDRQIEAVTE